MARRACGPDRSIHRPTSGHPGAPVLRRGSHEASSSAGRTRCEEDSPVGSRCPEHPYRIPGGGGDGRWQCRDARGQHGQQTPSDLRQEAPAARTAPRRGAGAPGRRTADTDRGRARPCRCACPGPRHGSASRPHGSRGRARTSRASSRRRTGSSPGPDARPISHATQAGTATSAAPNSSVTDVSMLEGHSSDPALVEAWPRAGADPTRLTSSAGPSPRAAACSRPWPRDPLRCRVSRLETASGGVPHTGSQTGSHSPRSRTDPDGRGWPRKRCDLCKWTPADVEICRLLP